jgi:hypothetical protein
MEAIDNGQSVVTDSRYIGIATSLAVVDAAGFRDLPVGSVVARISRVVVCEVTNTRFA